MDGSYAILQALVLASSLFELVIGGLYALDTSRQIVRVRKVPSDSALTHKYAKSFGITLLCLSAASLSVALRATPSDLVLLAVMWAGYHLLVIYNNVLHYNPTDIVIHTLFGVPLVGCVLYCMLT